MKDELAFMHKIEVWDLVEFLADYKSISCKWVFMTKKDAQGNIKRYKAKLVAKGFT